MSSDDDSPPTPGSEGESSPEAQADGEDRDLQNAGAKGNTTVPKTRPFDWHFAFGPHQLHWARIGHLWTVRLPNAKTWSDVGIRHPHWIAFKHTTGFLVGGEDEEGESRIVNFSDNDHMVQASDVDDFVRSREAYNKLHEWLDAKQLQDTSISIGPNGSYFARCGSSWIAHGLPKDLMQGLNRKKDRFTPVHVALGLHGAWIVLWSDNDLTYNLRGSYPGIGENNALSGFVGQVTFVALNPYEEDGYIIVGEKGCSMNANLSSREDGERLQKMMDSYIWDVVKRKGESVDYPVKINGVSRHVYMTPRSYKWRTSGTLMDKWRERKDVMTRKDNIALIGAMSVGAGVAANRLFGAPPFRALGLAVTAGVAGTASMWYGIGQGLGTSRL